MDRATVGGASIGFHIGSEATATASPVGRTAQGATDAQFRWRGLFGPPSTSDMVRRTVEFGRLREASELAMDGRRTVVTTRCLDCDWAGATLDDARRHARQTSHTGFRTVTEVVSASGRVIGEMVEVHQL